MHPDMLPNNGKWGTDYIDYDLILKKARNLEASKWIMSDYPKEIRPRKRIDTPHIAPCLKMLRCNRKGMGLRIKA